VVVDLTLLEADETEAAAAARDETVNDWDIAVAMAAEDEEEKSNVSEDPQYETFNDFDGNNDNDDSNNRITTRTTLVTLPCHPASARRPLKS
jgi:chitodextrinase